MPSLTHTLLLRAIAGALALALQAGPVAAQASSDAGAAAPVPSSTNAVLSGQAKATSIAQSSGYVRHAIDTIAPGAACAAENRRVFALSIKVLTRSAAVQPNDQRDALIGLMFSPLSASTQNNGNYGSKPWALDRLAAEAT